MRPAGRGELDSLYFTYPYFEAPQERDHLGDRAPVAIVGAGPIGMTAALTLARHGVASVLFESKETFNDGSRATCIARPSFHILERIGAVQPFLDNALGWTTGRSFYRGKQILEFDMPDSPSEKFRPMYNLQQQYTEQFLWQAIEAEPLIEMRWQSTVTGIQDLPDGIMIEVQDPNGRYAMPAEYALAADGARSPLRKMRGHRLRGENYEGKYVIADVQMPHDYPTIRRALFDPDCRRGGTVLLHKQPHNIWRIDYQLGAGESEVEAISEANVRASVTAVLSDLDYHGPWELEWWSTYSANTLALDDYRDGRLFFIGDSAHIVPIFGVRGLNNGLADAENIGWKLAYVLTGRADPALLDSYTPERRGATLDVFANASKSARFMTPPTRGWRLMRDAALNLALSHSFAGALANPRQMTPFTYSDSPIVGADDQRFGKTGPVAGSALPNAIADQGFLSDHLGEGFTLITFDQSLSLENPDLTVLHVKLGTPIAELLGAGPKTAYLVRPDGHIAERWYEAQHDQIQTALQMALGRSVL